MPYLGFSAKNDITINATSDLDLTSDNTTIKFGADDDVTITHDPDDGLIFKSIATADDNPFLLTIQTGETDLAANDVIGKIQFQAPDEGTGTDANLVSAAIQAVAEGDFSSSSNATSLQFMTGSSEAATTKMTILSSGNVEISNGLDVGTITTSTLASLRLKTAGSNNAVALNIEENSGNEGWGLGVNADGDLKFYNSGTGTSTGNSAVTFSDDDKVGIGTASPQQLLHVSANNPGGKIRLEMGQSGVADGDVTGEIQFYHNDSSGAGVNADIKGICTSSVGAGALTFGTGTTSTTERMRIDSSGRVGIGGTPNTNWRDDIANQEVLMLGTEATFFSDSGVTTELWNNSYVDDSDTFKNISQRGASRYYQYQGAHKWFTAASASAGSTISTEINSTPKMTLDVSGNLIVGAAGDVDPHNASSSSNIGSALRSDGRVLVGANGQHAMAVNRVDAGDIVTFKQGGSTAGIIGSSSTSLYIGNDDAGILFNDHGGGDLDSILPYDVGSGSLYNGHVDIGGASNKFRNIHISGSLSTGDGVTFGSTSGNITSKTLDDYEEGTWTPTVYQGISSVGYTTQSGFYRKVGSLVYTEFYLYFSGGTGSSVITQIAGLPYNLATGLYRGGGTSSYSDIVNETLQFYGQNATDRFAIYHSGSAQLNFNTAVSTKYIIGTFIYITT